MTYEAVDNDLLRTRRDEDADLTKLCTTPVTDMSDLFRIDNNTQPGNFNPDISSWDTGNVTTMEQMFSGQAAFNRDIGSWDTGNVTDMAAMFFVAESFNQDLSGWCAENQSEKPAEFDLGADSWTLPRPDWGEPCE